MLIRLEHIEKTYGTPEHPVPVLHDVNFSMEEGEYYAIDGAVRLRQIDADEPPRLSRYADEGQIFL
jgi:ABC-type antimicrobial peptide transport system, ATPase component